jgi:hypothetical protein
VIPFSNTQIKHLEHSSIYFRGKGTINVAGGRNHAYWWLMSCSLVNWILWQLL